MNVKKEFVKIFIKIWNIFLDFLLPQPENVARVEKMSVEEFTESAGKAFKDNVPKNIFPEFDYKSETTRVAIWELKYRGNQKMAKLLGAALYTEILADLGDLAVFSNFKEPLMIPIPISKKRRRERGFNQCELLVKEICKLDEEKNFKFDFETLKKTRDTGSQTKTSGRKERLENLSGCFIADPENIRDRNIILIDDVLTTGATLEEARKTLLNAGARKVVAFAIAH